MTKKDITQLQRIKRKMYIQYKIKIKFRDTIEGGIPADPEVIRAWIQAKVNKGELKLEPEEIDRLIGQTTEEVEKEEKTEAEQLVDATACTFKSDEQGLYIEARQVRAMLKEVANTLKYTVKYRGLKQVLQHGTYVEPTKIHLGTKEPDGSTERPIQTRFGAAFKRNDYVKNAEIEFSIYYVKTAEPKLLNDKRFKEMMAVAQENGLGANRSEGKGKFDILELDRV